MRLRSSYGGNFNIYFLLFSNSLSLNFYFASTQKKQKKIAKLPNGANNHDDPFGNGDDADVERITRELEAKYVSF